MNLREELEQSGIFLMVANEGDMGLDSIMARDGFQTKQTEERFDITTYDDMRVILDKILSRNKCSFNRVFLFVEDRDSNEGVLLISSRD